MNIEVRRVGKNMSEVDIEWTVDRLLKGVVRANPKREDRKQTEQTTV